MRRERRGGGKRGKREGWELRGKYAGEGHWVSGGNNTRKQDIRQALSEGICYTLPLTPCLRPRPQLLPPPGRNVHHPRQRVTGIWPRVGGTGTDGAWKLRVAYTNAFFAATRFSWVTQSPSLTNPEDGCSFQRPKKSGLCTGQRSMRVPGWSISDALRLPEPSLVRDHGGVTRPVNPSFRNLNRNLKLTHSR